MKENRDNIREFIRNNGLKHGLDRDMRKWDEEFKKALYRLNDDSGRGVFTWDQDAEKEILDEVLAGNTELLDSLPAQFKMRIALLLEKMEEEKEKNRGQDE